MPTVWFLASFPPPVGGKAIISELLAQRLAQHHEVTRIDISSGTLHRDIFFHMKRLRRALLAFMAYIRHAQSKVLLYVSLDGGLGLLYQLPIILLARARSQPVVVHHHNFGYITSSTAQMRLLVRCLPAGALHVFLCDRMTASFRRRYADQRDAVILSNIEFFREAAPPQAAAQTGDGLVVGLIAQLSGLKGADTFLALLRRAAELDLPIRGVLAGPFSDVREEPSLRALIAELGERVDYLGEVGGAAKEAFFGRLDVFLFPTRFPDEAQPLVLFEAASRGIPVISHARGCVADDGSGAFELVEAGQDFVEPALSRLREWLEFPDRLAAARTATMRRVDELRRVAHGQMEALLERLAAS